MEFHQIRYFLAACDHMNFTRAAEACSVSQPALSVAIQKLEGDLGGPLFARGRGQFSLTELGRQMRTHLAKVVETHEAARSAAAELVAGEMECIDLGVMCTVGPRLLGQALIAWRRAMPSVEIILHDVWEQRASDLLLSGAMDCVLMAPREPLPERLAATRLFDEPFELVVARDHELAGRNDIRVTDIADFPYLDRLRCEFRGTVFDYTAEHGIEIDIAVRSEREDWIQQLVAQRMGVTLLPRNSVVVGGLVNRTVSDLDLSRSVDVVLVRGRPVRDVVAKFVAFLAAFDWPLDARSD